MIDEATSPGAPLRTSLGRHPRDGLRILFAGIVVVLCGLIALSNRINPVESAIFRQIALLPSLSAPFWYGVLWAGTVPAIGVAAAVALFFKRVRLAVKLVVGGVLAWGMANVAQWLVGARPVPGRFTGDPRLHLPGADGFIFPAEHVAVAAALVTICSPYLGKAFSRAGWAVVTLAAVAEVYVGGHLPVDVLGGAFLGWGSGAMIHLLWGAPGRRTSPEAVVDTLCRAGCRVAAIHPLRHSLLHPVEYEIVTEDGDRLIAEIVRRGQRRAGIAYKARRFLASLDVDDEPKLSTPRHEVEHEAYVTLLAERAGVRTPGVVLARELDHGPALLVRRAVEGRTLAELPPEELDDALLDEIWTQVRMLGKARIAHHDLRCKNFLIDRHGKPWVLDFTFARAGASEGRVGQDVAETMLGLATKVGASRAVTTATRALSRRELEAALPYLQPLALPRRIRDELNRHRFLLTEVRETLAEQLECRPPSFRSRIRPTTILSLAVGGGAVYLLLPQVGTIPRLLHAVEGANYWWLAVAFLFGALTFPMAAASYQGAVRERLPFLRTMAVQVASAFTSRTTPGGIGGMGVNLIFLERRGLERSNAIGAVALNQTAGGVMHAVLFFAAIAVLGTSASIGKVPLPTSWPVLAGVFGALVLAGIVIGSPFGRRRIVRPTIKVTRDLLRTLRHPGQAAMLFGGSTGVTLANGCALAAALAAFGADFSAPTVVAVYIAGAALAAPAPTPGNLGAVEAALVAGLTGVGVASTPAVAAVLTFRLLTFWLPMLPGLATFRYLQDRGIV